MSRAEAHPPHPLKKKDQTETAVAPELIQVFDKLERAT